MIIVFRVISRSFVISTFLFTNIGQLIIGTFTVIIFGIVVIVIDTDLHIRRDGIVVCTVVGDVQSTVAVY